MKKTITGHNQKVILKLLQRGPMHYVDVAEMMCSSNPSLIKLAMERLANKGLIKKQNTSVYSL